MLPIYARAPWRSGYPGRPWQQLVAADRRMRLVDGLYLADSTFRRPLDMLFGDEQQEQRLGGARSRAAPGHHRLPERSAGPAGARRPSAASGMAVATRASTGRQIFDTREGTIARSIHPAPSTRCHDHSRLIEQRVAQRRLRDDESRTTSSAWTSLMRLEFDGDSFEAMSCSTSTDIEDMQAFMEQNPTLVEATQKADGLAHPDRDRRAARSRNARQVQRLLTTHLNDLLGRDPAAVHRAEVEPPSSA